MNTNEAHTNDGQQGQTTSKPEDGSTDAGTSSQSSNDTQKLTPGNQIDAIADLLRDSMENADDDDGSDDDERNSGSGTGDDDSDADSAGADTKPQALKLSDLAEKLEIDAEALYEVEIPLRDGTATLGQLKDAFHDTEASKQEIAKKMDDLNNRESGLVADTMALGILEAMEVLPKPAMQKAVEGLQGIASREFDKFTKLYPQFQDEKQVELFDQKMTDMLGEVGLTTHHFPVKTLGMYRFIKQVMDDRAELKRMKAERKTPPKSVKKRNGGKPPPKSNAPRNVGRSQQAQVQAISKLIGD